MWIIVSFLKLVLIELHQYESRVNLISIYTASTSIYNTSVVPEMHNKFTK